MEHEEILQLLRERIIGFAASRGRREWAEDVAQEVLLVLHVKYPHVVEITELVPLALQIARFKIMSGVRTGVRRGEGKSLPADEISLPDPAPDPESAAARRERLERMKKALATLGQRCRDILRLKLQGRTFAEIQAIYQVSSINTIYTWDFRCRKQLLEAMGGDWEATR
ncbi:MAG: sigma-70 family RNA polymerase sigma factor [Bryobacteraceae bacterium]|nr:sigma-70 family RNA polymerase sigma factor [Bryobacteraceae bacterium]